MPTADLRPTFIDLFSGIGGFSLGLERAGWRCEAQVEKDDYCREVLKKHWPAVPCHYDITTIDWRDIPRVDLVCGGFPCQPFSCAGKRRGQEDDRYLWPEVVRCLEALRPAWFLGENVPGLLHLGIESVLADLEAIGYQTAVLGIPACAVDAPHIRKRIWIVAYTESDLRRASRHDGPEAFNGSGADVGYTSRANGERRAGSLPAEEAERGCQRLEDGNLSERFEHAGESSRTGDVVDSNREPKGRSAKPRRQRREWPVEPCVGRVAHGVPNRVDRLKGLGNAIVPQIAEALGRLILAAEGR